MVLSLVTLCLGPAESAFGANANERMRSQNEPYSTCTPDATREVPRLLHCLPRLVQCIATPASDDVSVRYRRAGGT
ncbi:hypothetical protein F5B21DRAFT_465808 [Xylaria acuta]|nr:hypothetical protein F5B21DRAFT_465808 [Xylaria acuta]